MATTETLDVTTVAGRSAGPAGVVFGRSPSDAIRVVAAVLVVALGLLIAFVFEDALIGFERDLLGYVGSASYGLKRFLIGVVQVAVIVAPAAGLLILVILRRWRALGYALVAGAVAAVVVHGEIGLIQRIEPSAFVTSKPVEGWLAAGDFPDSPYIASAAAVLTVLAPWMNRSWRRWGWSLLWIGLVSHLLTAEVLPGTLALSLSVGWLAGALVLLVFGTPRFAVSTDAIVGALRRASLDLAALRPASVDARGSTPYFGETADGAKVFVKALTDRERSADLLFRLYRWARFRDLGDERPFSSLRRTVEHEALCSLAARDSGVATPRLAAIAAVDPGGHSMVLAYERVAGHSLDEVDADELDDAVLRAIWAEVATMRRRRIAHRDLRLANVFLGEDGRVWIIDYGFSELAASDQLLSADIAELVASTALVVGPERAVRAAVDGVGPEALATALPRLQPNALSGATRTAYKGQNGALDRLRELAGEATGAQEVALEHLERVSLKRVLLIVMLVGTFYFLLPQLGDLGGAIQQVRSASPAWVLLACALSLFTYVGAAISMIGAVPQRLPFPTTFLAQMASSFTNRITPAQAGGYATNVRFLQRSGLELPVAVTGVGLNSLGGALVHIPLVFVFLAWAGADGLPFSTPSKTLFLSIALGFVALTLVLLSIGRVRAFLRAKVLPALRQSVGGMREVVRRPTKLIALLGGSFIVTMSYTLAFVAAVHAFGPSELSVAQIGFAYLAGSVVASAAPTPGGLGAAEAALAAGLALFGLSNAEALPPVFLFRIATFWLPIVPGWLALRALQARRAL